MGTTMTTIDEVKQRIYIVKVIRNPFWWVESRKRGVVRAVSILFTFI